MKFAEKLRLYLPIICVMLLWGSMGIPSTYALQELTPLGLLCLRSGVAAALLGPYVRLHDGSLRPGKSDRVLLPVLALIGVVLCNYLYFYALDHTSLTDTAILYAVGPLMTAVLAAIFLNEHIRQSRVLGIVVAFVGVVALLTNGRLSRIFSIGLNKGDVAELCSAFCLASYTVLSKRLKNTKPACAVFWLMASSFVMTLPVVLLSKDGFGTGFGLKTALSVLYLGVLCSGVGYLLQQHSIHSVGAGSSAAFLNGISPITVLTAGIFLHERITSVQFLSMALVFAGLYFNAANRSFVPVHRKIQN